MSISSQKCTSANVTTLISSREQGPWKRLGSTPRELQKLAEDKAAVSEMEEIHCKLPNSVRATFLMAFSPDGTKVASTHGDHKIYICNVKTGKLLHTLEGHPRTPWCLAFHPSSNDILASGCLGGEVRVWDLHGGSEVWAAEENTVITSLAFHPMDKVLVIATFNQIHFWDWSRPSPFATSRTGSEKEKVRFVKFDPLGNRLITGISNLPPENFRNSVFDSILNQRVFRPPPSRSILTRLMSMYRHLEGLEELSWPHESNSHTMSPTQEEALHHAREYALATTHANRLQRHGELEQAMRDEEQLLDNPQPSTSGLQHSENRVETHSHNSETLSESHHGSTTRDFWATFQRLRSICSSLERTMQQHQQLQQSTESQVDNTTERATDTSRNTVDDDQEDRGVESEESSRFSNRDRRLNAGTSPQNAPQSLMSLLTRLQNSLQNAALTTAFAQEQIQQVRLRISEILERLANVSGYRARLTSLRDQIYEAAERTVQRGEDNSPSQRWDLAHCLWLVEMSLQLTRQMQRILAADYRLTQLHLTTSTSHSLPQESDSSLPSSSRNFSSMEDSPLATVGQPLTETCNVRSESQSFVPGDVNNLPHSEQQHPVQNRFLDPLSSHSLSQDNQRSHLSRLSERIERQARSWHENSPFILRRPSLEFVHRVNSDGMEQSSVAGEGQEGEERFSEVDRTHFLWLQSNSSVNSSDTSLHTTERNSQDFRNLYNSSQPDQLQINVDDDSNTQQSEAVSNRRWESPHSFHPSSTEISAQLSESGLDRSSSERQEGGRHPLPNNTSSHSHFRIPEVQIDASPISQEEPAPLPHHQRPRSPPLSTILSGNDPSPSSWGRVPPYLSVLYDSGIRPRLGALLGINETAHNLTHRIQCWDFTRFHIPSISDARKNVVVRKCKIHNDASVDISSDGELLAVLIPTTAILAHAAMLAIYSLNSHCLGQCLYTWGFEPNAISVSFSPLGRYIVVGLASSRLYLSTVERETVAQILKLEVDGKCNIPIHVRSLTQQSGGGQQPQVSLNSVCWLPQPGQGLIYGTNRGCLCICRPVAPLHNDKQEVPASGANSSNNTVPLSLGFHRVGGSSSSALNQMSSTATQTTQPQTQTTGTQTPVTEENRNRDSDRDREDQHT